VSGDRNVTHPAPLIGAVPDGAAVYLPFPRRRTKDGGVGHAVVIVEFAIAVWNHRNAWHRSGRLKGCCDGAGQLIWSHWRSVQPSDGHDLAAQHRTEVSEIEEVHVGHEKPFSFGQLNRAGGVSLQH